MAGKAVAQVEKLKRSLLREVWGKPSGKSRESAQMAAMACEDAAARMVALSEEFHRSVRANHEATRARIERLGDDAVRESRAEGMRVCRWMGLGDRSTPKERARVERLVMAEGSIILDAASRRIDAAVAANKIEDELAVERLRLRLKMVESELRRELDGRSLEKSTRLAGAAAKELLASIAEGGR